MKTHLSMIHTAAGFFAMACLQGCTTPAATPYTPATPLPDVSAASVITATWTKRPTVTQFPTFTRRVSPTPRPTRKPTGTPVSQCGIAEGWWASRETVYMDWMTTPWSIIAFEVKDCSVWKLDIEVFPASGKAFGGNFDTQTGTVENNSFSVSFDNPDGPGVFSVYGKFVSKNLCQGFLMFSKGFQVEDFFLPDVVTIPWNADPPVR